MLLSILLSLYSGQFFSQACKQGQDCNVSNLTVGNAIYGPTISNNTTLCSPGNSGYYYTWERNSQNYSLREGTGASAVCSGGSSTYLLKFDPLTPVVDIGRNTAVAGNVTANNFIARDGGVSKSLRLTPVANASLDTCNAANAGLRQYNSTFHSDVICDGLLYYQSAYYAPGTPIGFFNARTPNTGVITPANPLLGTVRLMYAASSATIPTVAIRDRISCQCATNGTGAGAVTLELYDLTNSAVVCTTSSPACVDFSITGSNNTISCIANITYAQSTRYGMRMNAAACATPPADCVCSNTIETQ